MSRKIRWAAAALLLCIFAGSAGLFFTRWLDYRRGEALYAGAAEEFLSLRGGEDQVIDNRGDLPLQEIPADLAPELTMDFDALADINPDIVAWIVIPDTNVNYPVLQGPSNDTYLRRAYDGTSRRMGSIFIDYRCSADLSDAHTIVYGHNMRNSTMFSVLPRYSEQAFYEQHRYFYIYTAEGCCKYEIFSAYMTELPSDSYALDFPDGTFGDYVSRITSQTWIASNVFPTGSDRIVSLSTCSSDNDDTKRFLVHGYLVEDTRP